MDDRHATDIFIQHENLRLVAMNELLDALRAYGYGGAGTSWPEEALAHVADVTFGDGAAFVTAVSDGRLELQQGAAGSPGKSFCLPQPRNRSVLWDVCRSSKALPLMDSHMTAQRLDELGLPLPPGSSFVAHQLQSRFRPDSCVCVWRCPDGQRLHSEHSFEVWDREELRMVANLLSVTIDTGAYLREVTRLEGIGGAMQSIMEVVRPSLVALHDVAREVDGHGHAATARKLDSILTDLDGSIEQTAMELASWQARGAT